MSAARIKGVLSPVVTPFKRDLSPDVGRFIAHCKWLLSQDCGLAVFGTNSEANSMSADERMGLLDSIVSAGVPTDRMMPGTGACSITMCALVPLTPNDDTPARRGRLTSGHGMPSAAMVNFDAPTPAFGVSSVKCRCGGM